MTQAQPAADVAIVAAYQQQTQVLRARLQQIVQQIWQALGSYRAGDQARFVRQIVPLIAAAQRSMSALTVGYLTAQRSAILGRSITLSVDSSTVSGAAARGGVDPAEVYGRPFHLVWRQLDELPRVEGSIGQAIDAGLNRAVQTALTDVQLSKVQTAAAATKQDRAVTGYQRVLEGPHSCALCIVASTQRYHRRQLLPIHGGCDCSVRPLYGDTDPDPILDPATLADVHDRIQQRFGASSSDARFIAGARGSVGQLLRYRDVLITHEHGELGLVLGVRGAEFTGPNDI